MKFHDVQFTNKSLVKDLQQIESTFQQFLIQETGDNVVVSFRYVASDDNKLCAIQVELKMDKELMSISTPPFANHREAVNWLTHNPQFISSIWSHRADMKKDTTVLN